MQRWDSPTELRALFGDIDSYDEAQMLAASQAYDVLCPGADSLFADPQGAHLRQVTRVEGGYELYGTRYTRYCPAELRRYRLFVSSSGELRELDSKDFDGGFCVGRVPAGLRSRSVQHGHSALGDHLAQCAHLEAASVHAFVRLADELRAHGAPAALVARALQAAQDEVRHARVVGALALAHGGVPIQPTVDKQPLRSLEELAHENAVEGCVRETYGALVGAHQAERADDPQLRQAMQRIALDEARHAALSHDVHEWALGRLDADATARIARAQHAALRELFERCAPEAERALTSVAGLPDRAAAREMIAALAFEVWGLPLAHAS